MCRLCAELFKVPVFALNIHSNVFIPIRRSILYVTFFFTNEGSISSSLPDFHNELHETGGCPAPANPTSITCGPSVTFGSPVETEKDDNQVKPTANLNPPISESINKDATNMSSDHGHKENDVSKDEKSLTPEVNPVANLSKEDITDLTTKGTGTGKRQPVPVVAANKESTVILVTAHYPSLKELSSECYSLHCLYFQILFPPEYIL